MNEHRNTTPHSPTATGPDSVAESVPQASDRAGKTGPNASDPPKAQGRPHDDVRDDPTEEGDLNADEGADAFETAQDAEQKDRPDVPERTEEEQITLDTPD